MLQSKVTIAEAPLVRVINMLKADPPRCGFQLEPDQVNQKQPNKIASHMPPV